MKSTLENKIAVVTGGSGAIGSAIIAGLEQQGVCAVSLDMTRPAAAPFEACDVRDDGSVAAAIAKVQDTYGRLDVVVHAAGVSREAGGHVGLAHGHAARPRAVRQELPGGAALAGAR